MTTSGGWLSGLVLGRDDYYEDRKQGQGFDRVEAYGFFSFLLLYDACVGSARGWVLGINYQPPPPPAGGGKG